MLHTAGNLLPALSLARDAARLNIEVARDLYTALVVKYADELYDRARSASTFPAMGGYGEARFVLMRAIDDLGYAPPNLRRAVDRIEQERARLIEQEWPLPDNSSEFQNPFLNTGS